MASTGPATCEITIGATASTIWLCAQQPAGITYTLTPAIEAAGYHLRDSTVPGPILTGDGKVVFVPTMQGWVIARWTP